MATITKQTAQALNNNRCIFPIVKSNTVCSIDTNVFLLQSTETDYSPVSFYSLTLSSLSLSSPVVFTSRYDIVSVFLQILSFSAFAIFYQKVFPFDRDCYTLHIFLQCTCPLPFNFICEILVLNLISTGVRCQELAFIRHNIFSLST